MSGLFATWLAGQRSATEAVRAQAPAGTTADASPADASAAADASPADTAATDASARGADPAAADASASDADRADTASAAAPAEETRTAPKRRTAQRPVTLDKVLAAAVDTARDAIAEVADAAQIGDYLGCQAEAQRLVTHSFMCTDPAYRGWYWIAVLARAPRSKKVTVCETALLPGDDALLTPAWVPWKERVQPGDLGPRDVLPKLDADPNLQPGYQQVETAPEDNVDQVANFEFGLGRERVLSNEGLANAAERWAQSEAGADGEFAKRAPARCGSCGYLMPIAGSMRTQFGVCANEWSPFDGRVVALSAGCGAHSETEPKETEPEHREPVVDDTAEQFEMVTADTAGAPAELADAAGAAAELADAQPANAR